MCVCIDRSRPSRRPSIDRLFVVLPTLLDRAKEAAGAIKRAEESLHALTRRQAYIGESVPRLSRPRRVLRRRTSRTGRAARTNRTSRINRITRSIHNIRKHRSTRITRCRSIHHIHDHFPTTRHNLPNNTSPLRTPKWH